MNPDTATSGAHEGVEGTSMKPRWLLYENLLAPFPMNAWDSRESTSNNIPDHIRAGNERSTGDDTLGSGDNPGPWGEARSSQDILLTNLNHVKPMGNTFTKQDIGLFDEDDTALMTEMLKTTVRTRRNLNKNGCIFRPIVRDEPDAEESEQIEARENRIRNKYEDIQEGLRTAEEVKSTGHHSCWLLRSAYRKAIAANKEAIKDEYDNGLISQEVVDQMDEKYESMRPFDICAQCAKDAQTQDELDVQPRASQVAATQGHNSSQHPPTPDSAVFEHEDVEDELKKGEEAGGTNRGSSTPAQE